MLLKPTLDDARRIAVDLGRILAVVAVAGLIPLLWAVAAREWKPAADLLLMIGVAALLAGIAESWHPRTKTQPVWGHGLIVVSLVWLVVPAVGAIPLALSGHYSDVLDAYFDAMSGLTTTGLATIQDLDHLASSTNVWRHALQFLGGQGIVLAALVFFSASGALSLYEAEGRDQRIFPSVGSTARFIWLVSVIHGLLGVSALTIDGVIAQGFDWSRSLFHGFTVFMAAFDTGGFSPQSTSIAYYHSASFEAVVGVLMLAGALSFGLHHAIWQRRAGLLKNIEVRTFATTVSVTLIVTLTGLAVAGVYTGTTPLLRRGFFQLLSAHTGTGFATVSTSELARWSGLAFAGMTVAMALGGMSSSTAGGVKALRIGLTVKSVIMTVREALTPSRTVISRTYFQYGRHRLEPELANSVMTVSLLYVALYLLGAAVGLAYGYGLAESLFESVSAAAAVGLSVGVVSPDMPVVLQIIMILQMWIGRLEFIAVFALLGFGLSVVPVSELEADPGTWDGTEVTVTGEIIGDYSIRDDIVWFQLNDDPYVSSPLVENRTLQGGNIGIGVRIQRADWSSSWGEPGRYGRRGPIVEVTGTFRHNSVDDQGETFIDGKEIRLVESARPIENPAGSAGTAIIGAVLAAAGLVLYQMGRRPQYRRV